MSPLTLLLIIFSVYFIFNLGRLYKKRLPADYLRRATLKTACWLIGLALLTIVLTEAMRHNHVNSLSWFYVVASAQLAFSALILASTLRHLKTTRPPELRAETSQGLPTLTVCIPARDETEDLERCLQSLVASSYPKLEILVLDDSSQNRRTPEIIRQFAHDGVRFLAGKEPPEKWLPKNYAYSQMADEANGEVLLFCGVDVRFRPDSLTSLVSLLLQKQKSMISLLPVNAVPSGLLRAVIQPARYAWELALPRRLINRPPVLSTCWLIKGRALDDAGGFAAVQRKVVPEAYFAKIAAQTDGYSFMVSDETAGLLSVKSLAEQKSTAIRTRYPQLHRRPELVALTGLAEVVALVWPLIICGASIYYGRCPLATIAGLAYLLNTYTYTRLVNLTYRRLIPEGLFIFPLAVIYDIYILNLSMWQYEFGQVLWKGRDVSRSVMRASANWVQKP